MGNNDGKYNKSGDMSVDRETKLQGISQNSNGSGTKIGPCFLKLKKSWDPL